MLTKRDFVKRIQENYIAMYSNVLLSSRVTATLINDVMDAACVTMIEILKEGEGFKLQDVARFETREVPARSGYTKMSGTWSRPAHTEPKITASATLKNALL